jgi:hypothetical protein
VSARLSLVPEIDRRQWFEIDIRYGDTLLVADDPNQTGQGQVRVSTIRRNGSRLDHLLLEREDAEALRDALTELLDA